VGTRVPGQGDRGRGGREEKREDGEGGKGTWHHKQDAERLRARQASIDCRLVVEEQGRGKGRRARVRAHHDSVVTDATECLWLYLHGGRTQHDSASSSKVPRERPSVLPKHPRARSHTNPGP